MQLHYLGQDYRLRVDRTGPRTYRIKGAAIVECTVDRIGDFESRITCNGRKHRVVAIEQGAQIRLEVDGVAHSLSREDGLVVRTGWPALVSSLLVAPGDTVTAGQPLAVLESMKMVSTVTSPFDGVVTSLAVTNNTQVERGAALMRIKAAAQHSPARQIPREGDADLAVPEGHGSVDLGLLALTNGTPEDLSLIHI